MSLILTNAFRRLGIPATATAREARRVIDEIAVHSSLGTTTALDSESLSQLRQALDNPVERLREELFWVHSSPDAVNPAIDLASDTEVSRAVARLQAAAGRGVTRAQAIALHDLAVIAFAHDVEEGLSADESTALGYWADVWASDEFWSYLGDRAAQAHDARLTDAFVSSLRQELPARVLAPVSDRAASFLDAGDPTRAEVAVRALRRSGMPETDVEAAARRAVSPLRARIEAGIAETDRLRAALSQSDGHSAKNRAAFSEARMGLVSRVLSPYQRLRRVDPLSDQGLADRVADEARSLSVSAFNVLDDSDTSFLLARVAMDIGRTPDTLRALARDQATVARRYHQDQAAGATATKRNDRAAAHFEIAADYAEDAISREHLLNVARGATIHAKLTPGAVNAAKQAIADELDQQLAAFNQEVERATSRPSDEPESQAVVAAPVARVSPAPPTGARPVSSRRWFKVAVVAASLMVLLALLYGVAHWDSSSSSSTAPATTAESSSTQSPAPAPKPNAPTSIDSTQLTNSACAALDDLDTALTALQRQIELQREAVTSIDARKAGVKATYKSFLEQHPEQYLSSSDYDKYVRLRRDVRTYQQNRNELVRVVNSSVDSYNSKLRHYKQLRGEC